MFFHSIFRPIVTMASSRQLIGILCLFLFASTARSVTLSCQRSLSQQRFEIMMSALWTVKDYCNSINRDLAEQGLPSCSGMCPDDVKRNIRDGWIRPQFDFVASGNLEDGTLSGTVDLVFSIQGQLALGESTLLQCSSPMSQDLITLLLEDLYGPEAQHNFTQGCLDSSSPDDS